MALAFPSNLPVVVIRERVWIPRELLISPDRVKAELVIENGAVHLAQRRGYATAENAVLEYICYEETEGFLIVPRAYPWRAVVRGQEGASWSVVDLTGIRGKIAGVDCVGLGPNKWQPFNQQPGFDALSSKDSEAHGRMFVLRCGGGKTAISMKAAHARGGRTLWVTITQALLDQARDDISRWLGIHHDHIGWVQGAKQDWDGFGVAVATLQSLASSAKIDPRFWAYWDLVIFDEGDVLGAPEFHKVVPLFRAERWVLTATPRRSDGMERLFQLHSGPTVYEHTEFDLKPDVHFIAASASDDNSVHKGWDPYRKKPRLQHAMTARKLLNDERRNDVIIGHIKAAVAKGRTLLVVGDSIEGIAVLRQRAITLGVEDSSIVTSRVTNKQARRDAIKLAQVVFATSKIFTRGLDRVAFDTLVLASMVTVNPVFVNQIAGRILRANSDDPDKRPIILVPVDVGIEELRGMAATLAKLCNQHGWPVGGIANQLLTELAAKAKARARRYQ